MPAGPHAHELAWPGTAATAATTAPGGGVDPPVVGGRDDDEGDDERVGEPERRGPAAADHLAIGVAASMSAKHTCMDGTAANGLTSTLGGRPPGRR